MPPASLSGLLVFPHSLKEPELALWCPGPLSIFPHDSIAFREHFLQQKSASRAAPTAQASSVPSRQRLSPPAVSGTNQRPSLPPLTSTRPRPSLASCARSSISLGSSHHWGGRGSPEAGATPSLSPGLLAALDKPHALPPLLLPYQPLPPGKPFLSLT